ncbi:MAG: hypothetical protein JSR61_04590 [Proteobacteria bacterium]|nr:hypothetical protein [Pseudomonadota bacterium]
MHRYVTIIAVIAFGMAIAAAAPAETSSAQTAQQRSSHVTKKAVKPYRPHRRGSRQIACTAFGCHPIPPNCHPQTGYRWDGMPSGFDVIVCR